MCISRNNQMTAQLTIQEYLQKDSSEIFPQKTQSPFYSAPSIFAVLRNLVREVWFEKYGSRNMVREKWLTRKKVVLYHKSTFFLVPEKWLTRKKVVLYHKSIFFLVPEKWLTRKKIRVCRTTFLEPFFYTFLG